MLNSSFVRAQGESMLGAGIHPDDILVIDRSKEPVACQTVLKSYRQRVSNIFQQTA
jgi:hypothetical protein